MCLWLRGGEAGLPGLGSPLLLGPGVLFQVGSQLVLSHAPHPAGDAVSPGNEAVPASTQHMLHVLCFTSLGQSAECFSL